MALVGFDSGEATGFPPYSNAGGASWGFVADKPSKWQVWRGNTACLAGFQTTTKYSGTTAMRINASGSGTVGAAMRRTFPGAPFSETYLAFMLYLDQTTNSNREVFELSTAAGAVSARIVLGAAGQVLIYAGATLKATLNLNWIAGAWHSVQLHQNTATNTLELKLDDSEIVDCSGTAMGAWTYMQFGQINVSSLGSLYIDCIQVNDVAGTENNSWPGSPTILTALRPTSDDGAETDWIRSSGANDFDMIKETNPDLDTTYVSSAVDGDRSLYGFNDLAEPSNTVIRAVCLTIVAKRADAARLIPLVSRGGTEVELDAVDVGVDYMNPIEVILESDPIAVGPWTQTNFNATKFGFKHEQV